MARPEIQNSTLRRLNKWIEREKISQKKAGKKNSKLTVDDAINLILDKEGIEEDTEDLSMISK